MDLRTQQLKLTLWCAMALFGFMTSCDDDDEPPSRQTNLMIIDESGAGLQGAQISVYATKEDWQLEQNPVDASLVSDGEGSINIVGLEPGVYYLDVRNGTATNWSTQITFTQPETFVMVEQRIEIRESAIDYLVGKVSKEYAYVDLQIEGTSLFTEVDPCDRDDTFTFTREGQSGVQHQNAISCEPGQPDTFAFTWSLTSNDSQFTIAYENGEVLEYTVVTLDEIDLVVSAIIDLEGLMIPATFHFQAL